MDAAAKALYRFYLYGRDDAEEDFDLDDFDLEALARRVLEDQIGVHEVANAAVTAQLAVTDFDGSIAEFVDDYEDELDDCIAEDEVTQDLARPYFDRWRMGFLDEAVVELETEIIDQMEELLEEDRPSKKNPGITYVGYAHDGAKDAMSSWDADEMEGVIAAVVEKARAGVLPIPTAQVGELATAEVKAALEPDQRAWVARHGEDAKADGLDPVRAYQRYWWPAYQQQVANMVAERAVDELGADAAD